MLRHLIALLLAQIGLALDAAETRPPKAFDAGDVANVRAVFDSVIDALAEHYQGTQRLGADFRTRAKAVDRALVDTQKPR